MTCAAFSIKFAKTNQKFAEISEFCEKNSLLLVNYSLLGVPAEPLGGWRGPPAERRRRAEHELLARGALRRREHARARLGGGLCFF